MTFTRTGVAAIASLLVVGSLAAAAPGGHTASRQRIAIDGTFNTATGKSTWRLIPLTTGALKGDSGTGVGTGKAKPARIQPSGQSMIAISGGDALTGRRGTIELVERVTSFKAGSRYTADVGTWSFAGRTGAYAGYTGGGGFGAVYLPSGLLKFRMEGYVAR
ncbi:MAG: hypothetical protein ACXWYS_03765 [Gaiellaceae bacterium]